MKDSFALALVVGLMTGNLYVASPLPGAAAQGFPATCRGLPVTIMGTPQDDLIIGTDGDDVIAGLEGNDTIRAGPGNDVVCGGPGNDIINGGLGRDKLFGQEHADVFKGSRGRDRIHGGPRSDGDVLDLSRAPRAVSVDLASGEIGGWGGKSVTNVRHVVGSRYDDVLLGNRLHNTLSGGAGNDEISGRGGSDDIKGQDGHDTLVSSPGVDDFAEGGNGDDLFLVQANAAWGIDGGPGDDAISFPDAVEPIEVGSAVFYHGNKTNFKRVEVLFGTPFDDVIDASGLDNYEQSFVFAGDGNDVVTSSRKDTYLDGGAGDDTLISSIGYSILVGGEGDDHLESRRDGALMAPGAGINTVVGSDNPQDAVTYELEPSGVNVNLRFGVATWAGGSASLQSIEHAVGTDFADVLTGDGAQNILVGLDGDDALRSGAEADLLYGDGGSDLLDGGAGFDYCFDGEDNRLCDVIDTANALTIDRVELSSSHAGIDELLRHHAGSGDIRGANLSRNGRG